MGLATAEHSTAMAANSSYVCVPICSVSQQLLYAATVPDYAGTRSSSFTHRKRLAQSFRNSQRCCWQLVCWNTQAEKYIFLKSHKKRSPCQMNPAFCWLLSIYPSLLSQFKLQNYHATQAEGGVQTLALLVPYYHTWSLRRHCKHVRWLRDVSPRAPPWRAASTRASFSLPFLLFPLPALMLLALSGAGREQQKPRQQLSVGEYKQDASAPGFSRRASLEWRLTAYRWLLWAQTQVAWVCQGHFWKAKTPGMWIQTGHLLGENFAANVVL